MDKWKDVELEKMKVGGNRNAREFFESQSDWDESMSISQRYNTKAAALYRDKVERFIIHYLVYHTLSYIDCHQSLEYIFSLLRSPHWREGSLGVQAAQRRRIFNPPCSLKINKSTRIRVTCPLLIKIWT